MFPVQCSDCFVCFWVAVGAGPFLRTPTAPCVCVLCLCVCFRMPRGLGFPEAIRSNSSVCSVCSAAPIRFCTFFWVTGPFPRTTTAPCVCVCSPFVCVCVSASECSVGLGSPKRFAAAALCVSCVVQQLFFAAAALSPQNDPCAFALAPNARFCWGCGVISLVFGR